MRPSRNVLSDFVLEALRFEKKKLILPFLAVSVVLLAVLIGGHLRSQGIDEKATDASVYAMTELTVVALEHENFNQSIDSKMSERRRGIESKAKEMRPDFTRPLVKAEGALLGSVYFTPLFPVAPGGNFMTVYAGSGKKAVFFSNKQGYYLTEELPESLALIKYRRNKLQELGEEVNSTGMSLQEFRNRVQEIKSHDAQSQEVRSVLESSDSGSENQQMALQASRGQVKEIGLIHFAPAILAAFVWNYVIVGFLIASFREIKSKLRD